MSKSKRAIIPNSFDEAISMYLEVPSDNGTKKGDFPSTYEKKLEVFKQYLYDTNSLWERDVYWMNLAKKIELRDIKGSMRDYVDRSLLTSKKVTKEANLRTYFSVVSGFLRFLHKELKIENAELFIKLGTHDKWPPEVIDLISEVSIEKGLKIEKEDAPILEEEEYKEIATNCYNYWERYKSNPFDENYKYNRYKSLLARLLIQLYLFTGISSERVPQLKTSDLSIDRDILWINNYEITLPQKIVAQLKDYLNIRNRVLSKVNIETDQLFISDKGDSTFDTGSIGKPDLVHSPISRSLETHSTSSCFSLVKHAIIEMIKQNISIDSIERLTGQGPIIIRSCYDHVYELDISYEKEYVNNRIRMICQDYKL